MLVSFDVSSEDSILLDGPALMEGIDEEQGDAGSHDDADSLTFLRDSPQFAQICQLVRGHPEMLPQVLAEFANTNPELFDLIRTNQQQFLQMLNDGALAEGDPEENPAPAAGQPAGGAMTIMISEGDRDAIQRVGLLLCLPCHVDDLLFCLANSDFLFQLQSMGFPEQLVIEAYLACDKNEDLAVNYILARMEES